MHLKALLLCEDVRLEVDGTLTLIGVRNDRLLVRPPRDAAIVLESLTFLLVVGGLTGCDRIGFRGHHRGVDDDAAADRMLTYEPHAPASDEHNFIFAYAPVQFPRLGTYELVVDVETATHAATYLHRYRLEAAA